MTREPKLVMVSTPMYPDTPTLHAQAIDRLKNPDETSKEASERLYYGKWNAPNEI